MDLAALFSRLPIGRLRRRPPLVTVLALSGVIGGGMPLRPSQSFAGLAGAIEAAFKPRRLAAVALVVNSPGGSPVQSALIHRRIRQLADEKKVPVFAFVEDVAASGGYWLALAADEIFADENSIVGSIGVISAGFGFVGLMASLGIERRLYARGERKVLLDPFSPERPEDVARIEALQADIHGSFKALVRARRAARLSAPEEELFSGDIWTGRRAVELGLVDGLGDLRQVLRGRYGDKVRLRRVGDQRRSWLLRRLGLGAADPAGWARAAIAAAEERAAWQRFGL